ncbi:MAG: hypothetical protein AAGN82_18110 [Myxococcota bacterium]
MRGRTRNLIKFRLERLLLRGTLVRLLLIGGLIALISVVAGLFVHGADRGGAQQPGEAIWWAFLRLTDPGYLGDDRGPVRRAVATVVTLLGYVVFLGALVAILTQWLDETIDRLQSGYTPIAINGHVLVLGWTSRHQVILRELLTAEDRVERFLARHGRDRLAVVILVPHVTPALRYEVRDALGPHYSDAKLIFRSGNPLRVDHLKRADFLNAAAIIFPSDDLTGEAATAADTRTIKTLLTMSQHAGGARLAPTPRDARAQDPASLQLPLVVTEMLDQRKIRVARGAYRGPVEILAADRLVGCLLAQSALHEGLSDVFAELMMDHDGCMLRIAEDDALVGVPFSELAARFPRAIPIGLVRPEKATFVPRLLPAPGARVREGEAVVLVARTHDDVVPLRAAASPQRPAFDPDDDFAATVADEAGQDLVARGPTSPPRVLVLGWSSHVPALLGEFGAHRHLPREIVLASVVAPAERQRALAGYERDLSRLNLVDVEVDYTVSPGMSTLAPETFDQIIIVQSDWAGTDEEGDARTVVGYLMLREALRRPGETRKSSETPPRIIVELGEPANEELLDAADVEVLVTPLIVGQLLAEVALRPELNAIYDQLLGVGGAELVTVPASPFGGEKETATFDELSVAIARRGGLLLGSVRRDGRGGWAPELAPLNRAAPLEGRLRERLLVILVRCSDA